MGSDWRSKPVPEKTATKLAELRAAKDAADKALRKAVVDALKADGSIREVARHTGLSTNTVNRWGQEDGWPTPQQRLAWMEAQPRHYWPPEVQAILDAQRERNQ